ncbi:HIT family protein [Ornithinimicrobium pratense]|uniref:HIT family protein n=1 Tax=Ornithinimicrobium pratense TaxID=2593973 RepID=A0A5J6V4E4_9MICO|nr:HIT family protein [Ornithinimicrobium pratense]QFG68608.1 HIT family protein [Ornithinimicrobium pratense]
MASIFSKIISGDIPGQLLWTDEVCAVFLDIEPLTAGHALVVPRAEIDHWLDLPGETLTHLMDVAARVGRAQEDVFAPARIGMIIQGFEVPHAHLHVFPAHAASDFELSRRSSRTPEQLAEDADVLRAALRAQGDDARVPGGA